MKKQYIPRSIFALVSAIRNQANILILTSLSERGINDILPAHGSALNALFKQSPLQMNKLAEYIGRKKNTVTGLVTTLENRGYCYRTPDPQDARVQLVFLTEKGEAMRQIQEEVSDEILQKAWNNINEETQIICIQSLKTIFYNLKQDKSK